MTTPTTPGIITSSRCPIVAGAKVLRAVLRRCGGIYFFWQKKNVQPVHGVWHDGGGRALGYLCCVRVRGCVCVCVALWLSLFNIWYCVMWLFQYCYISVYFYFAKHIICTFRSQNLILIIGIIQVLPASFSLHFSIFNHNPRFTDSPCKNPTDRTSASTSPVNNELKQQCRRPR